MNRKGFTLIELIATIALLAIVAIISFVSITKILEKGKISDCESLVKNIKTAANEYVSDNRYKSGVITGQALTVNAQTLIDGKYLSSPIVNPFTKDNMVASSILMTIELYDDYTVNTVKITAPSDLTNCSK